ncbi:MAG: galactokinase [Halodesulfurarchaeum sp.]
MTTERIPAPDRTATQLERAGERLIEEFGDAPEPVSVASAPGRVNLIGGHTDYNDGFVLPLAIDRRHLVACRPRDDDRVAVHSMDLEETDAFSLDRLRSPTDPTWVDYVKGVVHRFQARGHEVGGAELVVNGRVPMGAGLSSSAALEVSVAGALAETFELPLAPSADGGAGDQLVEICWEAETQFVGLSCGIMDQYTAVHAEPSTALFLDCRRREHESIPVPADDLTVVVTDTNVQHDLVDSAYNERVTTCEEGVAFFDETLESPVAALRDVPMAAFRDHADDLEETVRRRVRHIVSENDRVREAADALREGDLERVGALLEAAHESLRADYEVSVPELDAVVSIAGDLEGVYGSRMTGAGFGGAVVTLVQPDAAERVMATIEERYRDRTGVDPDIYACNPDGGLRTHDHELSVGQ